MSAKYVVMVSAFQSTLPMKGATRFLFSYLLNSCVSIHAPNEGSDAGQTLVRRLSCLFQSTLPMKGATSMRYPTALTLKFQSTLPMKGATL